MRFPFSHTLSVAYVLLAAPSAFCDWQTDSINANRRALNQIVDHHDAIINDIRNRNSSISSSSSSSSSGRSLDTRSGAQIRREQEEWKRNWQQHVAEENADRDAWNAHVKAYNDRQYKIYLENARIRAENEEYQRQKIAAKPGEYAKFLAQFGGMGTKEVIPFFATDKARFDWYLNQANAGDTFAAFWVGRAMLSGDGAAKNPQEGAKWLQKADPKFPLTATFLGTLLVTGEWLPRDEARGRELLEFGAQNDRSGEGARLYGEILQAGIGLPKDEDAAALQFFRALNFTYITDFNSLWESYGWTEPGHIVEARKNKVAAQTRDRVRADPSRVVQWLSAWGSGKPGGDERAFRMLMREIDMADEKSAQMLALPKLDYVEANNRPSDAGAAIDRLIALKHPDAKARALLADGEYLWLSKADANDYWREAAAKIEAWAAGSGPLQSRARAALLARDLGRWSDGAPPPTPEKLRALIAARNWNDAPAILASQSNRLNARDVVGWTDGQAREFLEKMGALDASYKTALALYDAGTGRETKRGDSAKQAVQLRFNQTKRDLQAGTETFSPQQLAAARLDFARAAGLQDSQPIAAFPLYLKALQGGDALAAWHLAAQEFPLLANRQDRQWLLDTLDARLQRDVRGEGDMAATAAFALHLLHSEANGKQVYGRRINRFWTLSKPDTTDWFQVAMQKRHPWAIHFSNSYAAQYADDKYNEEAQKIWPWLAANFPVLSEKRDLWERDCRWLDMESPAAEIARLQKPLAALEKANLDANRFKEVAARLPEARQFCAVEPAKQALRSSKEAQSFYTRAFNVRDKDNYNTVLLPFNRATCLELLMQAAIGGHPVAPLDIGVILQKPQFPLEPNPTESAQWLAIAKDRLVQSAKTGPVDEARESAALLASELNSGIRFPKDEAQALKYTELAANLGDMSLASVLQGVYENGEMGATKNPAMVRKWEKVFQAIVANTYKIPPALLVGRAK